jgi:hypothetical protein
MLIIGRLSPSVCCQLKVAVGSTKAWTTQANPMEMTERAVCPCSVNPIGTDHCAKGLITPLDEIQCFSRKGL